MPFQGSLPIYSLKIAVSVVDNVLLVHQVDAKVVILYDLFNNSLAPISAPLPLLLRGFSRTNSIVQSMNVEAAGVNASEVIVYADGWTFLVPDLICDTANGMFWRIHLDLEVRIVIRGDNGQVLCWFCPGIICPFIYRR